MTKEQLRQILYSNILLLSSLHRPEQLSELEELFGEQMECGANVLVAPTFLSDDPSEKAEIAVRTASCVQDKAFCAGAVYPPEGGLDLYGGELSYDEYYEEILLEVKTLSDTGCISFLLLLGFQNLLEAKCAVLAAREASELPLCVGLWFRPDGKLSGGEDAATAVITLQSLGVNAVGCVGQDPDGVFETLLEMKEFASVPLFAYPDVTNFYSPYDFGDYMQSYVGAKCAMVGAGEGSDTRYVAQEAKALWQLEPFVPDFPTVNAVCGVGGICFLDFSGQVVGKNKNIIELKLEKEEDVDEVIKKLIESGVPPVCFHIKDIDALRRALMLYPGRPAVKSDEYGEITAKEYGALVMRD